MSFEYVFIVRFDDVVKLYDLGEEKAIHLISSEPLPGVFHPLRDIEDVAGELAQAYIDLEENGSALVQSTPANPTEDHTVPVA